MKYKTITVLLALFSISISAQDSLNCRLLATTGHILSRAACLARTENYVYVSDYQSIAILDVTDVENPKEIYRHSNIFVSSIFIDKKYAYLASDKDLIIWDISQIDSPKTLSNYTVELDYGPMVEIVVYQQIAYVGTGSYALLIIDVSDPRNPFEISRIDENIDDVWGVEVRDNLLFAASEDTGLKIFDISDPSAPVELSEWYINTALAVKLKDDVAYVSNIKDLYAFDISDPENPVELFFLENAGGLSIDIEGNYLYSLTFGTSIGESTSDRLSVVDISDPGDLKIAGYYPLPYISDDVIVKNNIAFATCDLAGIYIIQFDEPTTVVDVHRNAPGYSLAQNYPNPLNPSTNISYTLPHINSPLRRGGFRPARQLSSIRSAGGGGLINVQLKVYDMLGCEVATLVDEHQTPGSYNVNFDAGHLSSGVYFYTLQAAGYVKTRKMVLLK